MAESKVHVQDGPERNRYSLTRSTLQVAYVLHFTAFSWLDQRQEYEAYVLGIRWVIQNGNPRNRNPQLKSSRCNTKGSFHMTSI
jgi:hypothetical protein